jgi:hypothetical protein
LVTIIKLYILFIAINFGWGMIATGILESNANFPIQDPLDLSYENGECDGLGEPACQFAQSCPVGNQVFDDNIHHKLCQVGIQNPLELTFDADPQSPDISGNILETSKTFRNVTSTDGTVYQILVEDVGNNATGVDSSTNILGSGFGGEFFSFLEDTGRIAGFGAKIFLDTFTGGFILDVLGTGIMGVAFPTEFLDGIKILIGIAIASYFGYLFIGKPLLE